jgi:hypothetical protein
MSTTNHNQLLLEINKISKSYDEMAERNGELFNIFKVLKVESSEVRLHSAFLAELLNPNGSHGCGETFLRSFMQRFKVDDFNFASAQVEVEKLIGWTNED